MTTPLRPPLRLALEVHKALARPGLPVPVTGRILDANNPRPLLVNVFIDPEPSGGLRLNLQVFELVQEPAQPRGRHPDDGRRVAVLLAERFLTDVKGQSKAEARNRMAGLLGYKGEREVRRVFNEKRTKELNRHGRLFILENEEQDHSHIVCLVLEPRDFDPSSVNASNGFRFTGYVWQWGAMSKARLGQWTLTGTKPGGGQ